MNVFLVLGDYLYQPLRLYSLSHSSMRLPGWLLASFWYDMANGDAASCIYLRPTLLIILYSHSIIMGMKMTPRKERIRKKSKKNF